METQRRFAFFGTVAAATMLLSACGAIGGEGASSSEQSGADDGTGQLPAPQVNWTLQSIDNAQLGKIMADGKGLTLYIYAKDRRGAKRSACLRKCAKTWTPVTVNSKDLAAKGLDITKISRFRRQDTKDWQLTYNGWPLYRFSKDTKPGDVNGQKVKGWFVLDWRGNRVVVDGDQNAGADAGQDAGDDGGNGGGKKKNRNGGGNGGGGNDGGDDGGYGY